MDDYKDEDISYDIRNITVEEDNTKVRGKEEHDEEEEEEQKKNEYTLDIVMRILEALVMQTKNVLKALETEIECGAFIELADSFISGFKSVDIPFESFAEFPNFFQDIINIATKSQAPYTNKAATRIISNLSHYGDDSVISQFISLDIINRCFEILSQNVSLSTSHLIRTLYFLTERNQSLVADLIKVLTPERMLELHEAMAIENDLYQNEEMSDAFIYFTSQLCLLCVQYAKVVLDEENMNDILNTISVFLSASNTPIGRSNCLHAIRILIERGMLKIRDFMEYELDIQVSSSFDEFGSLELMREAVLLSIELFNKGWSGSRFPVIALMARLSQMRISYIKDSKALYIWGSRALGCAAEKGCTMLRMDIAQSTFFPEFSYEAVAKRGEDDLETPNFKAMQSGARVLLGVLEAEEFILPNYYLENYEFLDSLLIGLFGVIRLEDNELSLRALRAFLVVTRHAEAIGCAEAVHEWFGTNNVLSLLNESLDDNDEKICDLKSIIEEKFDPSS